METAEKPDEGEMKKPADDANASEDRSPSEKSSQTQRSSPPAEGTQPSPVLANTPRPPSVNSTHSGASSGNVGATPVRTTTTSRRGGRIRSRSPPTMTNRPADYPEASAVGRSHSPPQNPSSVAAAAASAAKALSSGAGGRSSAASWSGPQQGRQDQHPRYYEQGSNFESTQAWPGEQGGDGRGYGQDGRHSQSIHRGRPQQFEQQHHQHQGYSDGQHQRSRHRYPGEIQGGQYDGRDYDGPGYGYGDNAPGGGRGDGAPFDQRSARMRQDYYGGPAGMAPVDGGTPVDTQALQMPYSSPMKMSGTKREAETPSTVKRRGGTSRVIGTPTPIHVPRAADPPTSQFTSQSSASSVFRGRPDDADDAKPPAASAEDETGQRLLLSLRTPSTSFEETKPGRAPPLSPEGPPKIQNAHQQRGDQPLLFEPQRSPRSQGNNLEMAPSFSLFNHSFDSLGEAANYLGVDMPPLHSGIQSHSFGAGPTGSGDHENAAVSMLPPPIDQNASFGNAQILGGSSSGGLLTFGMSPENSFGNGPPSSGSSRRRGNMMILADDGRAQSPTQVLGMYPSYSGGYGAQPPVPQAPFRPRGGSGLAQPLGAGSFGPSMSQSYTRSFDGMATVMYPGPMAPLRTVEHPNGALSFYPFLRRNRAAFIRCSFLLPGLKSALLESPLSDTQASMDMIRGGKKGSKKEPAIAEATMAGSYLDPKPQDTVIAMRRITSSVCAFGGSVGGDHSNASGNGSASASSIFRTKSGAEGHATVTPSSSSGTPPGNRQSSRSKAKYDELLPTRYYENENRLSWEFEETPPIAGIDDEDDISNRNRNDDGSGQNDGDFGGSETGSTTNPDTMASSSADGKKSGSPDQPKMRYRCKLCGLPKQNHTCPYQQSLQRSIGTMVYPAVNAFTSNEPGLLAPTLTDMNNFISSGSESVSSPDTSPGRPSPVRRGGSRNNTPSRSGASNVTPDTKSATSTPSGTPQRSALRTPRSSKRKGRGGTPSNISTPLHSTPPGSAMRKRSHAQMSEGEGANDLLFVDAVELKPEQFRMITPSKNRSCDAYTYPSLPLPYAQRKRLSDNLFALSKDVPQLTDECAVVLREAREKDMWDLAVAELMTQVIIIIHCHEADTRMEGLRQYLLTLGIAC
eukprot:CAMPEP_0202502608 /NCGR_PEP_ID=MMETSP1361-20130828/39449_1 /ASSEMBLY_ACC=CAM_ASM_000849 /TAXON_ID=210615 /ORGANISM="Staurosira complex sp., Strain CCMP2646" /LENGTH=1134 /DNA_ID=CAMNT_0049135657 /DNA_START=78 /DNA_END=3482 /DNA_ORIENTATION=+